MPGVGITAVDLGDGGLAGDVALGEVVEQLFTGTHGPDTPRGDHLQLRSQRGNRTFKTHLIVTLTGATVSDGIGAFSHGRFHHRLGDNRTGHGGTQQVGAFVDGASLQGRIDVILDELFLQILDDALGGTRGQRLLFNPFQIVSTLTHIGNKADHFAVIVLFEPWHDGRGIQTAGIGQNDLVDALLHYLSP